jgi:phosphate-selective porin
MRWPMAWSVLLAVCLMAPGSVVYAQTDKPANSGTTATSKAASEEEVEQLRREVAELKATLQKLVEAKATGGTDGARLVEATASQPASADPGAAATVADVDALQKEIDVLQKKADTAPPATSGWNGEHFYLKSSDGNFTLMPVGYLNTSYTFYNGDGAPSDTFKIGRARFGVQGSYGKQLDYAFLFETASSLTIRDAYVDFKPWHFLKFMGGQYKVPFSMEVGTGDTAVEFNDRSIVTVLYPDAGGGFRAPGVDVHGDLYGGRFQYWGGVFNGKGLLTANTTNEVETVGRIRIAPWAKSEDSLLKGFAIGGSAEHSRSKGLLTSEISFSGALNDGTYTFFPQFRINGGIERYNGFFIFLKGSLGVRGEYTQILEKRVGLGSFVPSGVAFNTLPGIQGKGGYAAVSYLLTGEKEPENALPRVKHPVIGPNSPGESGGPGWGAWMLKVRYSWLEGRAPGITCDATTIPACPLTPGTVPSFSDHTDQFSAGVNWYLNYWVLLKSDVNVNRLINPSVQGINPRNYYVVIEGIQFRF